MDVNRQNAQNVMNSFVKERSWKAAAIITGLIALLSVLLNSILFDLIVGLLKIGVNILFIGMVCYTGYLVWPTVIKKYKDTQK